ncbi:MAG: hypothetical protein Q7Q71_14160, partial [Verrucomicrobiota bacterium JB023]|nr:hypothetical protein [Verrucomicrobiota bacterium JB023]
MTKTPYLTDFPRTVFANAKRRRQAEIRLRRDELASTGVSGYALLFEDILSASFLKKLSTTRRERHFSIPIVFWAWLSRILDSNAPCGKALSLIQTWCLERGIPSPGNSTSGYCSARARVTEGFLQTVANRSTDHLAQRMTARDQWRGLTLKAIDGSSVQLMDTAANQKNYPQPSVQKEGCGFPTMGIVGITNLSHGGWEGFETCPWSAHDSRIAPRLLKHIHSGDLL